MKEFILKKCKDLNIKINIIHGVVVFDIPKDSKEENFIFIRSLESGNFDEYFLS